MGRAYAYAEGDAPMPGEIELGHAVDRYGGMAVYGRTIGAGEMRSISMAEGVVNTYKMRESAVLDEDLDKDLADWSAENKGFADLLGLALREAIDLGLIDGE